MRYEASVTIARKKQTTISQRSDCLQSASAIEGQDIFVLAVRYATLESDGSLLLRGVWSSLPEIRATGLYVAIELLRAIFDSDGASDCRLVLCRRLVSELALPNFRSDSAGNSRRHSSILPDCVSSLATASGVLSTCNRSESAARFRLRSWLDRLRRSDRPMRLLSCE